MNGFYEWRKCLWCFALLVDRNEQTCFCNGTHDWKFRQGLSKDAIDEAVQRARSLPMFRTKHRKIDAKRENRRGTGGGAGNEGRGDPLIGRFCALSECNQFFITKLRSKKYHKYECQIRGQYLRRKESNKNDS